jgi:hypothetical protein
MECKEEIVEWKDMFVNLELSKKLKELNVNQQSFVKWIEVQHIMHHDADTNITKCIETRFELNDGWTRPENIVNKWVAFTVSELLELLPSYIRRPFADYHSLVIKKFPSEYEVKYCNDNDSTRIAIEHDKNLANALAKLLVYCVENKLIRME